MISVANGHGIKQCLISYLNVDVCTIFGKTTWDWLDLLIAPAMLAAFGIVAKQYFDQQDKRHAQREKDRQEERLEQDQILAKDKDCQETLKDYFDKMTSLILDEKWPTDIQSYEDEVNPETVRIVAVARARTLAILRELDGERKGSVVRFLDEADALQHISLVSFDLKCADLRGINLRNENLYGVNLGQANLAGCDLEGATLINVDFREVNLTKANLIETNFMGANLAQAILTGANLTGANLSETNLEGANLTEATLEWTNLKKANLKGAVLIGSYLVNANLTGADLEEANLTGSLQGGANLTGANLKGANLEEANLEGVNLARTNLEKANLSGAVFTSKVMSTIEESELIQRGVIFLDPQISDHS